MFLYRSGRVEVVLFFFRPGFMILPPKRSSKLASDWGLNFGDGGHKGCVC